MIRRFAPPMSIVALAGAILVAATVAAHNYTAGALRISHPWITPAAAGAPTTAAYFTILNTGRVPDRLVAIEVAGAARADLHHSTMTGGIMRMRRLDSGLVIPPGATVRLAPGGDHVMVSGLARALRPGDHAPAILTFERAGRVQVTFAVERFGDAHGSMVMPGMSGR